MKDKTEEPIEPHTEAYLRFDESLSKVAFVIQQLTKGMRDYKQMLIRLEKKLPSKELNDQKSKFTRICILKSIHTSLDIFDGYLFMHEWTSVMLLTMLQEYLEESLITISNKNPNIMKGSNDISWVRVNESESIGQLMTELRREWAQSCMRGKGPIDWFKKFENMGSTKYDRTHVDIIQHLFDTRNVVVHYSGRASTHYIKQHPKQFLQSGKVRVTSTDTLRWAKSAANLVEATDSFILKYGNVSNRSLARD